jgi:hypothetical protein
MMKLIAFISTYITTWLRLLPFGGVRAIAAETLIQMIKRKFNKSLSEEDEIYIIAKIQQASAEQLTQWVDDVLDAMTLNDLFKMFGKNGL